MLRPPVILRILLCCAGISGGSLPAAVRPPLIPAEQTVGLPPVLVDTLPNWRYVSGPGYEILSLCSETTTAELARGEQRLNHLLNVVLPQTLRVKLDVPTIIVAYDQHARQTMTRGAVMEMLRGRVEHPERAASVRSGSAASAFTQLVPAKVDFQLLTHLRLWDRDQMAILALLPESGFTTTTASLTPDYLAFLINNRTPALPVWFIQGMLTLFPQMSFADETVKISVIKWFARPDPRQQPPKNPPLLTFAELRKLKDPLIYDNHPYNPRLLPLKDFFDGKFSADQLWLWRAQAMLFVRWMFDPNRMSVTEPKALIEDDNKVHALKKTVSPGEVAIFVDQASRGKVTEKQFQECFGIDFSEADEILFRYVRPALRESVELAPATPIPSSLPKVRPATLTEVARIKGELERLQAGYVRPRHPEFARSYLELSLRTFGRAMEGKERDPVLLISAGLSELEMGNEARARELLEAGAKGEVIRPRAYYELARLRLAELRGKAAPGGKSLSAAQTASVLQPLFRARGQAPALPAVYVAIAETWSSSATTPSRQQLAVLDEGINFFPTDPALVWAAASTYALHGYSRESATLLDLGQKIAVSDEEFRIRFAELRAKLEQGPGQ